MSSETRWETNGRWDLIRIIREAGTDVYRDYESFCGPEVKEKIVELVAEYTHSYEGLGIELEVIRDICANLLLEYFEHDEDRELDDPIWRDRIGTMVFTVYTLLSVQGWTKSGISWEDEDIARGYK